MNIWGNLHRCNTDLIKIYQWTKANKHKTLNVENTFYIQITQLSALKFQVNQSITPETRSRGWHKAEYSKYLQKNKINIDGILFFFEVYTYILYIIIN